MIIYKEYISLIISAISLGISAFLAYRNIWLSRARIDIVQTDKADRSMFIKSFDGNSPGYEYSIPLKNGPIMKSVLLIEVIITNKSSLPISILEFYTKDFPSNSFTSYSDTKESFRITERPNSVVSIGEDYPIKYLQPEFTIQPYTSERGYLLFWTGTENEVFQTPSEIDLNVSTSRKKFNFKVRIPSTYKSIKKEVRYTQDDNGDIIETFL
ncbi:hypothetical protein [Vagococcus fluvialis]|uniref:hypothetical protein n=1 Tax=Vagococcus fluvialis TaxID=2738 RepID=UPI002B2E97BD|nr:hypothetical protein QDW48_06375 [Vagococcus fluvialis]